MSVYHFLPYIIYSTCFFVVVVVLFVFVLVLLLFCLLLFCFVCFLYCSFVLVKYVKNYFFFSWKSKFASGASRLFVFEITL